VPGSLNKEGEDVLKNKRWGLLPPFWFNQPATVPGSLDKKGGQRCHLLRSIRWHLLPPFKSKEPGTGFLGCAGNACPGGSNDL
jgi:hypothetical protein